MNTINPAAAAAREAARGTSGKFGEQHRDPAPEGLINTYVPGNPEYDAVQSVIRSQDYADEDALDAGLADGEVSVDQAIGMLRETYRKGSGTDAHSEAENQAVSAAIGALFDGEDDLGGSLAAHDVGADAVIGMMRETYEAGQRNAAGAATNVAPTPAALPDPAAFSEQFLEYKRQAAELIRKGDRVGARSIAASIKRALPDAAYLRVYESDQSMTHGFVKDKILDKDKQFLADIDDDTITTDEDEEVAYDGESVWEVLSDLPQLESIPIVETAPGSGSYMRAPEYAWLSHDTADYALIDLNAALADD